MPRRPKTVAALPDLIDRLGQPSSERIAWPASEGAVAPGRRHTGWRWLCGCSAFARGNGDYLWIPCSAHDLRRTSSNGELKLSR